MKRVQFFEIEDQSWCPAVIRDGITDYLQFTINAAEPYKPIAFERVTALTDAITFHDTPVDARRVPPELRGTRTLFTSFHHFSPDGAHAILRDAAQSGNAIAVFEATQRSVAAVLVTLLSPLIVLLATPAIRPFRWSRLFCSMAVGGRRASSERKDPCR